MKAKLKKIKFVVFTILLGTILSSFSNNGGVDSIDDKVDELLSKMTLNEKIGQLNLYNGFWDVTGPVPEGGNAAIKYKHLTSGLVGGMLNVAGTKNVYKIQKMVVENTRLGIPLLFGFDVIHGYKTISPIPLAEAASWDIEAIEKSARIAAIEASAAGLNWTFAPMVDVSRDARWGRVMEGAGEDTYLGSKVAVARVKGFQGEDMSSNNTIAACTKHLAAYGFVEAGRDYNTVEVSSSTLYNVILPPFKATIDAGVKTVMNSFNELNGVPATADAMLQRDILKGEWVFEGFVVSDWGSQAEMVAHGYATDGKHAAELSLKAGSDMDMESYFYVNHLKTLVEEGKVDVAIIDDAVRRILKVKFELGLFEDPYKYINKERERELTGHKDHHDAVLDVAKKSIVLLKNKNNLLPLPKKGKKIALIGPLANDKNSPLGSWTLAAERNSAVSVLEGFKNRCENEILFEKGCKLVNQEPHFYYEVDINTTDSSGISQAVDVAKNTDVVVVIVGEYSYQTGEGRSRTKLDLPGLQQTLLEEVFKVNKNVVLVLMNGRPLTINWADKNIPAILEAWHLGTQSGNAIAQVIFGEYNPSGKLPMSFPKSVGQVPIYYNRKNTGRPNIPSNSTVFWSHYTDESNEPLYPFGYGLSYTDFKYSDLQVKKLSERKIEIKVTVQNTGKYDGEEVVQLYIRDKVASVIRPVKELKGFEKIFLKVGESKNIRFELTEAELGFFKRDGSYVVEPGEFDVWVGTSSAEGLKSEFNIN